MQKTNALRDLHGVGEKLAQQLNDIGIRSITDLLLHLPFRYEDRTRLTPIGSVLPGQRVLINGKIEHSGVVFGRRRSLIVVLNDGTGLLYLRFFHFRQQQQYAYKAGGHLRCFGEVRAGYKGLEMVHPSCQRISAQQLHQAPEGELTPIYPSTAGLQQPRWLKLTEQALRLLDKDRLPLTELLPAAVRKRFELPMLKPALQTLHRPPADTDTAQLAEGRHPAQRRLILEELAAHQLAMQRLSRMLAKLRAPELDSDDLQHRLRNDLPYQLTAAQQRVISELDADLTSRKPMLRLLQGDVGSGKTVVAAMAIARAVASGWQAAIVAPTELLAEQHLRSMQAWFEPLDIEPVWLTGKLTAKQRREALARIAEDAQIVIGTHALMQPGVVFRQLGLVIVDEQHRFGVGQRLALRDKGMAAETGGQDAEQAAVKRPHQLIMTATPIPRTLAMTAYAGLEVSVIDELPPGRTPVKTAAIDSTRREQVLERVAGACRQGRQAYWVCTLVEESDQLQAQAAEQTLEALHKALPDLSIDLIHGRMKARDKEQVMQRFRRAEVALLVATTVIEVGVDVPNASLMIIENAERLGLAQLHQLRGRVGRGAEESSCVLLYQAPLGAMAKARLETMRQTSDGFVIAEKDLELRGPGELLGTRQTGLQQLKIADLTRDHDLLDDAISMAEALQSNRNAKLGNRLIERWIGQAAVYAEV